MFLDGLKAELAEIEGEKVEKNRKMRLRAFQRKLAGINVFDPACGSGNFLTESYLSLRKLENRVLESLQGNQIALGFDDATSPIQVGIHQFYGIEINDFAVSVAKTALWIAEEQMMEETQEILQQPFNFLPLKSNGNICEGNALRMDWDDVLPAAECSYIVGNPPFLGSKNQSEKQRADVKAVFGGSKNCGIIDYVACWYVKASEYIADNPVRAAFVSTNSICQGEQVAPIWTPIKEMGVHLDFAYDTFRWSNEAGDQAHVFVVIVGFSKSGDIPKKLFHHPTPDSLPIESIVDNINFYLKAAPDVLIERRRAPLCQVPPMTKGCQPTDGGNLIIEKEELESFLSKDPKSRQYIKKLIGAKEFIQRQDRYCLWLDGVSASEIETMPEVKKRVEACRAARLASSQAGTRKLAQKPAVFRETYNPKTCLIVPMASSERRAYIPMGFIGSDTISTNLNLIVQNASIYQFGVMQSQFHNAWMRVVAGRLKSDYRYSAGVVYNNFVWPDPSDEQRMAIEANAQAVLDVRDVFSDKSLAYLYDPDKMPADLLAAHEALDAAVEAAYGVDFNGDEEKIVAHLFKLYSQMIG